MKISFTEHDVIAMHAELAAIRERVHKLILVREIVASHRFDQINHHFRLLEKLVAWRRRRSFDRSEVLAERQCRTQRRVCSVDDTDYCIIKV